MKATTMSAVVASALLFVSACRSNPEKAAATVRMLSATIPTVDAQETIGIPSGPPPLLVLLDRQGQVSVAAGPTSWSELASFDAIAVAKQVTPMKADQLLRMSMGMNWTPQEAIARMDEPIELSEIPPDEGATTAPDGPLGASRPPPPLVGEPPRGRAQPDAPRDELAAAAGGFGGRFATSEDHERESELGRFADVVGEVKRDRRLDAGSRGIVLADPRARAVDLIDILRLTESLIGVRHAGRVSPLRIDFRHHGSGPSPWTELRMSDAKLVVEAVPGEPVELVWSAGKLDRANLASAIASVQKHGCGHSKHTPVDILVDPTIEVQRLIDVLVALDLNGVRAIGLGRVPELDGVQAKLRGTGRDRSQIQLTGFEVRGMAQRDAIIALRARQGDYETCYATTLKAHPEIGGMLVAKISISETGAVVGSKVEFSDDQLARCVQDAIARARFPAPGGPTEATAWMQFAPDSCRSE